MPWKIHVIENAQAIRAQCSGSVSMDDLEMLAIETSYIAKEHGYDKVLLDLTGGTLAFPSQSLSALLDVYAECRMPVTTRIALVLGSEDWPQSFATVLSTAKQYGYSVDLLAEDNVKPWLSPLD